MSGAFKGLLEEIRDIKKAAALKSTGKEINIHDIKKTGKAEPKAPKGFMEDARDLEPLIENGGGHDIIKHSK